MGKRLTLQRPFLHKYKREVWFPQTRKQVLLYAAATKLMIEWQAREENENVLAVFGMLKGMHERSLVMRRFHEAAHSTEVIDIKSALPPQQRTTMPRQRMYAEQVLVDDDV
ncbi:unnamed protein product [Amoebophrya sp. A25]|nr:unnamed protein product [Amoebophrya sp. A25]|eukprot:GSA25T00008426001.1